MKKIGFILLFIISLLASEISFAQMNTQSASQLAFKYFNGKEYKPASTLFYELYDATKSRTYFNYYIQCLTKLNQFKDAEKFVKKQIKKNPGDKNFLITLGHVYEQAGRNEESKAQYEKAINKLAPVKGDITSIASSFIAIRKYEFANKAYEKGKELLKLPHAFHFEIANCYLYQKNFDKMVEEYMIALSIDQSKVNLVQNRLQSALFQDFNESLDPILRNQLLKNIQSAPDNFAYKELLQWYFVQKKQFEPALTQARSIDLLKKEDGFRLMALANSAKSNKDFATAIECYQLVVEKGSGSKHYIAARVGELQTRFLQLENQKTSQNEWTELAEQYKLFLASKPSLRQASQSILEVSHIQAFYLDQSENAIKRLEQAIKNKGVPHKDKSKIKMELADIKLFSDNKWDAILLYSQIEKSNKNNPIGYEAKYRKAKVSYYMGEFKWAKAQLDALKGSTSKLISNDAIALSQLIADNTTLDTSYTAMKKYAEAEFLRYQRKNSQALLKLDDLLRNHPAHSLNDEALFLKYEIFMANNDDEKALEQLGKIIDNHPMDILAGKALLLSGELHEKRDDKENAISFYKKIVTGYPDSIHSVEARQRLNQLRK